MRYFTLREEISSTKCTISYAIITDMEPKLPSPEKMPSMPPHSGEYTAQQPEQSPERIEEQSPERIPEHLAEHHRAVTSTGVPAPITLPTPIQTPADDSPIQSPPTDDMPLTAADDDLIEKEWVDKAKKIVTETRDDPHLREKEVGKLQADYLRKRYGKELGEPS